MRILTEEQIRPTKRFGRVASPRRPQERIAFTTDGSANRPYLEQGRDARPRVRTFGRLGEASLPNQDTAPSPRGLPAQRPSAYNIELSCQNFQGDYHCLPGHD